MLYNTYRFVYFGNSNYFSLYICLRVYRWALIKDKDLYERMVKYMDLNTYGVSRETQLRALKLLKHVVQGGGHDLFEFGYGTMKRRWELLSKTLENSKRFSLQDLSSQYCTFLDKHRTPSPGN